MEIGNIHVEIRLGAQTLGEYTLKQRAVSNLLFFLHSVVSMVFWDFLGLKYAPHFYSTPRETGHASFEHGTVSSLRLRSVRFMIKGTRVSDYLAMCLVSNVLGSCMSYVLIPSSPRF